MWNLIPSRKPHRVESNQKTFVKRGCLRISLQKIPPLSLLPSSFEWLAWQENLLSTHAQTLYESFQQSIDSVVFPNLGSPTGCSLIVDSICGHPRFFAEGTWLLTRHDQPVGTVQALLNEQNDCGLIQNIGVVPTYRGYGFGRMLLLKVLHAFRCQGMVQAQLEVTMKNHIALNLYYSLGFRQHKIVYREVTPVQGEQLSI